MTATDQYAITLAAQVPAAARGDRDAFAALVEATRSVVSSIALAIVRDADLSRDVAQDVFLAAWRDLGQLRDPNSFLPWLRQLTRHRAYHVLRTERRRARHIGDADTDSLIGLAVDPRPDAGEQLLAAEERRLLAIVLEELPDDAREVVTLFYREGQSAEHVAALLGLSEANVRQRLSRARARLRADLLDRYGDAAAKCQPGARFTAVVMTAAMIGAPSASSAATLSAATLSGPWLAKLLAFGGGAIMGATGGIAGILTGTRQLKRGSRSIDELEALTRLERTAIALVLIAVIAAPLSWAVTERPLSLVIVFVAFTLGMAALQLAWLPRILRDRHAEEALEDPVRAADSARMRRRFAMLGWALGLVTGGLGLIAAILLAG